MNFVFLSPAFPPDYYLFCKSLKQAGFAVLGIGETDFGQLRPELRETLAWYYKADNMRNYAELSGACRFFTGRFGQIDRLDSLNEYWLESEARLRTEFGVFGVKTDTISDIRKKSRMKKFFADAGIPHARGALVDTPAQARAFAAEVGFPIIVKPDNGMGAEFTYRLDRDSQVDDFFSGKPDREFIAEEFIRGDIVTFDGLADREGKIIFHTSHVYGQGVMEAVLADSHIYYYSLRQIPSDLANAVEKLVKGFNIRERFFHFEFFRKKDGTLCALEVNIRPPGGFTVDMFNYACDIDMYGTWARVMANGTAVLDYKRKYHCCHIGRKRRLGYKHSHEEVLRRFGPMIVRSEELPEILARAMGDQVYLVRAENVSAILEAVSFIQELR